MSLDVCEIFHSIQGEGCRTGLPCTFVRLSGCNLRCTYCDTTYAYEAGRLMSMDEVLKHVGEWDCPFVTVTGGEPLLQAEVPALVSALLERGHTVVCETNGSLDTGGLDPRCVRIVDVKCPSSGEASSTDFLSLRRLSARDEIKFVICDREDFQYACRVVSGPDVPAGPTVLFSPAVGRLEPARLAEWILADRLPVRLNVQLHALLWPGCRRGK